jgi:hypothetical protein
MQMTPGISADQLRIWRERARLGELTDIEAAKAAIAAIRKDFLSAPAEKREARAKSLEPKIDRSSDF